MRRRLGRVAVDLALLAVCLLVLGWLIPPVDRKVGDFHERLTANDPRGAGDLTGVKAVAIGSTRVLLGWVVASVGLGVVAGPMRRRLASVTLDLAPVAACLLAANWLTTLTDGWIEQLYINLTDNQPLEGLMVVERVVALQSARGLAGLAVASVGLGVVAVRRPGPSRRRDRWPPGRVAAAIGLIVSATLLATEFMAYWFDLMEDGWGSYSLDYFWGINAQVGGTAIVVAWLLMAVSGRWRGARRWRDGLGLALGLCWLIALAWQLVMPMVGVALTVK